MRAFVTGGTGFIGRHVADGIIAAHDKGRTGQSYVLGGHIGTMGELVRRVAELSGRTPPKHALPTSVVRASLPLAPLISRAMGLPSNLRELVTASDGVTYWARDDKARRELGYAPSEYAQQGTRVAIPWGIRATMFTLVSFRPTRRRGHVRVRVRNDDE